MIRIFYLYTLAVFFFFFFSCDSNELDTSKAAKINIIIIIITITIIFIYLLYCVWLTYRNKKIIKFIIFPVQKRLQLKCHLRRQQKKKPKRLFNSFGIWIEFHFKLLSRILSHCRKVFKKKNNKNNKSI